jgi:hypothetical protein
MRAPGNGVAGGVAMGVGEWSKVLSKVLAFALMNFSSVDVRRGGSAAPETAEVSSFSTGGKERADWRELFRHQGEGASSVSCLRPPADHSEARAENLKTWFFFVRR